MIRLFVRTGLALAAAGILLGSLGCEPAQPIRAYTVPKPEVVYEANHVDPGEPKDADGNPLPLDDRMLTAFIPHGEMAWYVKLSGPKEAIAPYVDAFQAFVKSFKFSDPAEGEPTWELQPDWTATKPDKEESQEGISAVFSIVTIGKTNPPLQIRVTLLPLGKMDLNSYILLNVNRWRGQLSLPAAVMPQMKKEMQEFKIADGSTAYFFDMSGKLQAGGMPGVPPMAGHPPFASKTPVTRPGQPDEEQAAGIKYETPAGWHAGAKDAFSQVALEAGEGPDKIRVTFSALSAAAGELSSNVNRWRAQVGLPPQESDALLASVVKMDIGGSPGSYVELTGPAEAIFGAIVIHDNKAWFLKMRGSTSAAQAQQANFRELLKSIRFE